MTAFSYTAIPIGGGGSGPVTGQHSAIDARALRERVSISMDRWPHKDPPRCVEEIFERVDVYIETGDILPRTQT